MKRGAPEHPKMRAFARTLGVPHYAAVGLLELLWHFTAKYAPQGDVGRFDNAAIAEAIGYDGESDALVDALVRSGWVDACTTHRLIVHGWEEHADQGVRNTLKGRGLAFLSPTLVEPRSNPRRTMVRPQSDSGPQGTGTGLGKAEGEVQEGESRARPDLARDVLAYVNEVGGTHYEPVEANLRLIRARLAEYDDWTLAAMIRRQWATWKLKPDMRPYFRPKTLFAAENCAQYVGQLSDVDRAWIAQQRRQAVAS